MTGVRKNSLMWFDDPSDQGHRRQVLWQLQEHYSARLRQTLDGEDLDPVTMRKTAPKNSSDPAERCGTQARCDWYKSAIYLIKSLTDAENLALHSTVQLDRYHNVCQIHFLPRLSISTLCDYHDHMLAGYDVEAHEFIALPDHCYAVAARSWHTMAANFLDYLRPDQETSASSAFDEQSRTYDMTTVAPTIGRIVHYTYPTDQKVSNHQRTVPGIVTNVFGPSANAKGEIRELVNLTLFPDLAAPEYVGSTYEGDAVGDPGTWAFPKYEPPRGATGATGSTGPKGANSRYSG